MKTLTLSLKKQWFDLIKSGEKKEEYRELNYYWVARLLENERDLSGHFLSPDGKTFLKVFKHFDTLVFTLGYPKAGDTERRLTFKNPKIRIGTGKPEWGAEPEKIYFVITWEK